MNETLKTSMDVRLLRERLSLLDAIVVAKCALRGMGEFLLSKTDGAECDLNLFEGAGSSIGERIALALRQAERLKAAADEHGIGGLDYQSIGLISDLRFLAGDMDSGQWSDAHANFQQAARKLSDCEESVSKWLDAYCAGAGCRRLLIRGGARLYGGLGGRDGGGVYCADCVAKARATERRSPIRAA